MDQLVIEYIWKKKEKKKPDAKWQNSYLIVNKGNFQFS